MAIAQRLPVFLRRIFRPSAIRYQLLVASDPRYDPLFDSLRKRRPTDRLKEPSPWLAWRAVPAIERDLAGRTAPVVMEWGAGGSTPWFAARAGSVVSIEHDREWYDVCREYIGTKSDLRHVPEGPDYADPDVDFSRLDCMVIDGVMRIECARTVARRIAAGEIRKGTLIVFDNSERDEYREGIEALEAHCARWRSFTGPTGVDIDQMTTLFWV